MPIHQIKLSPKQNAFLKCTQKVAGTQGGRGSGKSFASCVWLWMRMRQFPKGQHAVIGPDYPTLKRGFKETFTKFLDSVGEPYKFVKDDMTLVLRKSGARLLFLSAELQERIRSLELDSVFCDEIAVWKNGQDVFTVINGSLRPSPGAKMFHPSCRPMLRMAFNPPNAGHWLWELIENQKAFPCWKMSTYENTVGYATKEIHRDYIDNLKSMLPKHRWIQEIDGEWGTTSGGVYKGWNFDIHTKPPEGLSFEIDSKKQLVWALDFNVARMSSVVCQMHHQPKISLGYDYRPGRQPKEKFTRPLTDWQEHIAIVQDEIVLEDAGIPQVVAEFVRRYGEACKAYQQRTGKPSVVIYGDASGSQRNQAMSAFGPNTNWDVLFQHLREAGIAFEPRIQSKNPRVEARVNAVTAAFETGAGYGMLVNPECEVLIKDFTMVQWTPDGLLDQAKKRDLTHISDALGYFIWFEDALRRGQQIIPQSFMGR